MPKQNKNKPNPDSGENDSRQNKSDCPIYGHDGKSIGYLWDPTKGLKKRLRERLKKDQKID